MNFIKKFLRQLLALSIIILKVTHCTCEINSGSHLHKVAASELSVARDWVTKNLNDLTAYELNFKHQLDLQFGIVKNLTIEESVKELQNAVDELQMNDVNIPKNNVCYETHNKLLQSLQINIMENSYKCDSVSFNSEQTIRKFIAILRSQIEAGRILKKDLDSILPRCINTRKPHDCLFTDIPEIAKRSKYYRLKTSTLKCSGNAVIVEAGLQKENCYKQMYYATKFAVAISSDELQSCLKAIH